MRKKKLEEITITVQTVNNNNEVGKEKLTTRETRGTNVGERKKRGE